MNKVLQFIKKCFNEGNIYWSYHSNMRLDERSINRNKVFSAIEHCEIIEDYRDDFPLPSCLCLGYDNSDRPIHFVVALDRENNNIRMVTIYRPDPLRWNEHFKQRRKNDGLS